MENDSVIDTVYLEELPFSHPRTKSEVQTALIEDINTHSKFILSGVTMIWSEEILSRIDIAFWVQTPKEERLKRIQSREEKRFGARALAGGDMYAQQMSFRKMVASRDEKMVEESAGKLNCPIVILDGTLAVEENLEKIMDNLDVISVLEKN